VTPCKNLGSYNPRQRSNEEYIEAKVSEGSGAVTIRNAKIEAASPGFYDP